MLTIIPGSMQAITTKYHGPGNVRGARISATTESGVRVSVPIDHGLDTDENHANAARALCAKLGWSGTLVSGGTKNGNVYVFLPDLPTVAPLLNHAPRLLEAVKVARNEAHHPGACRHERGVDIVDYLGSIIEAADRSTR
jgi:hypothetical protein